MALLVILALLLVSLCSVGFIVDSPAIGLSCLGGAFLTTHASLALYGWVWNRGWFDLLAKQK